MRQSKAIFHSILSYDDVYNTKEEEEEDHGISLSYWVTRLEQSNLFSLSTNITSLDANLKAFEYHDQLFLSVLAGMCLYPNIASVCFLNGGKPFRNVSRKSSEYVYNTMTINNVLLHPTWYIASIFSNV